MNTKLHDKWVSQYREIYQAIANLQDEFEHCENVFNNVLSSLENGTVLELCLDDAVDELINDIACDIDDGVAHKYTFNQSVSTQARKERKFITVSFDEGATVILSLYELGNHMSIIITDDTNTKYYLPFSSLRDLIQ